MKQLAWLCLVLLAAGGCARDRPRPAPPAATGAPAVTAPHDNIHLPQSRRYAAKHDSGPAADTAAAADVARLREPVPVVEPRSRYGNGPKYSVRGRHYTVLESARGYRARGIASWYGNKFHGHLTSSLEPYDMYKFSAAHKTLPLPSWARVTNLDNGASVIVRINDRGPFHDDRLIDLSWAAAARLGIVARGTGLVEVVAIDPAAGEPAAAAPVTGGEADAVLFLQVGAYAEAGNAAQMLERLEALGVAGAHAVTGVAGGATLTRVRIGPLPDVDALDQLQRRLHRNGIDSAHVIIQSSVEE